ncbi:MAG: serine/threonine-protein phosphatase [Flavobacteriales bacterium]|nr:serine/threonine-protein phosphatase [Flavobacteriales bacterium]
MELRPKRTKHKVLYAVYAALLVLCLAVIIIVHRGEQKSQQAQGLAQLRSITSTLSEEIGASNLQALVERYDGRGMVIKNTQDARYYVLHERLRKSALKNGLSLPLELVINDTTKQELQVIVTSEERPRFRERWTGEHGRLMAGFGKAGSLEQGDERTREIVAFDVVTDAEGSTVGIVVARAPASLYATASTSSLLRNIVIAGLLFGLAGFLLFRYVGRWLKMDEEAQQRLKERHEDINDSIAYAGKIQRALVPSALIYDELFADSFVIDRPKDIVSGDFHWVYRIDDDTCFVAAADCTGHGLPGAMMAAIGCSLLNEIVPAHSHRDPSEILSVLHTRMVATLNQQGKQRGAGDGMDVALCRVDRKNQELLFAGAFRPLYWLHQGQLSVINGDRRPVGGGHTGEERKFTAHKLAYTAGDRIYLFSDGYVDQFGGPERKRFMNARLQELILAHRHLGLKEQAVVIEKAFLDWKGPVEQMDDVCMLGLAV